MTILTCVLSLTLRPAPDRPFPAWSLLARVPVAPLFAALLFAAPLFAVPPLRDCPPLRESVGLLVNSSSLPRRSLLPGPLQ
jgi:hypothetical protein